MKRFGLSFTATPRISLLGGRFFAVYLAFLVSVWLRDVCYFSAFAAHMEALRMWGNVVFAAALAGGTYISFRRFESSCQRNTTWIGWMLLTFLSLLALSRMAIPDTSCDTVKYHLYLQQHNLYDNIRANFFPASWWTFTLPMGDNAFGIMRFLLGYRLGTALNALVVILLYIQTRDILAAYSEERAIALPPAAAELLAFLVISTDLIFINFGMYMVDLLPVPLLLEMFAMILLKRNENASPFYYAAFLPGMAIALKLTSVPIAVIFAVAIVIRRLGRLSAMKLAASVIVAAVPVLPYLAYNYIATKNPMFPYYNSVFKSVYFSFSNFRDGRWLPHGAGEFLAWPFIVTFSPQRFTELNVYSGRMALAGLIIGVIVVLWFARKVWQEISTANPGYGPDFTYNLPVIIGKGKWQGINCALLAGAISCLFALYSWVQTTAYCRYAVIIELCAGILIGAILIHGFWGRERGMKFFAGIAGLLLVAQVFWCYHIIIYKGLDWGWRTPCWKAPGECLKNAMLFGRDRSLPKEEQAKLSAVDVWFDMGAAAGTEAMLNSKAIIGGMDFIQQANRDEHSPQHEAIASAYADFKARIKDKRIFVIADLRTAATTEQFFNNLGFRIADVFSVHPPFLPKGGFCSIMELESNIGKMGAKSSKLLKDAKSQSVITDFDVIFIPQLAALRDTLAKDPNNRYTLLTVGSIYLSAGRIEKAEWHLKKAQSFMEQTHDPNAYADFFLGQVRERQGRLEEAYKLYSSANAKIGGTHPGMKELYERMRARLGKTDATVK